MALGSIHRLHAIGQSTRGDPHWPSPDSMPLETHPAHALPSPAAPLGWPRPCTRCPSRGPARALAVPARLVSPWLQEPPYRFFGFRPRNRTSPAHPMRRPRNSVQPTTRCTGSPVSTRSNIAPSFINSPRHTVDPQCRAPNGCGRRWPTSTVPKWPSALWRRRASALPNPPTHWSASGGRGIPVVRRPTPPPMDSLGDVPGDQLRRGGIRRGGTLWTSHRRRSMLMSGSCGCLPGVPKKMTPEMVPSAMRAAIWASPPLGPEATRSTVNLFPTWPQSCSWRRWAPHQKRLEADGEHPQLGLLSVVGDQRDRLHAFALTNTSNDHGPHSVESRFFQLNVER